MNTHAVASDGEEVVAGIFRGLGCSISRVLRSETEPRPDFEASDQDGGRYLVEVKSRLDSEHFNEALERDGLAITDRRLNHDDAVEKLLKSAEKQLAALRTSDSDFSIVAVVLAGSSPDILGEQLRATLWGTIGVVDVFDHSFRKPCFYLGHTAFVRYPEIDGVLTIDPHRPAMGLYPNKFSRRRLENSRVGRLLAEREAVYTPEFTEAMGGGLTVPVEVETSADFRAKLRAIQTKTGRPLTPTVSRAFQPR